MISGQTLEVEFKECLWETTQVDNLILYSFDLLWGYKTPKDWVTFSLKLKGFTLVTKYVRQIFLSP